VKSRTTLAIVTLFVATLALYSRAFFFPFCVIDDGDYVTNNVHVASGLSIDNIAWAFTAFHSGNWHPLTWLSLMLDSQLFGVAPAGFHLVNIVFHALNAALLFLLFRYVTGAVWRSAFVAACFAFHPLHVESVAWIAERKDVLSTLFLILTLLLYSGYVKQAKRGLYLCSLAAFVLGLMAKPMLVTLPVILLLLDFWPFERLRIRFFASGPNLPSHDEVDGHRFAFLVMEKVPFVLFAAVSSTLTLFAQKPSISTLTNVPLLDRGSNALLALVVYVEKMFFPFDLAIIYPLVSVPLWKAGCAAAILAAITFMVIKCSDKRRYLAVGWFWYLITLLPVLGIIQVGRQALADRYTYIPFIGLFIMASWGGGELCSKLPAIRKFAGVAAAGVCILLSAATWIQLGYWRDNFILFDHALKVTENNHFAHYSLGLVYEQQKRPELAITEYMKSIEIEPRDPMVHFDLGFLFDAQGNPAEAIRHFEEAIRLNPGFAQAHFTLGIVLGKVGKINESIRELGVALRIEPDNTKYLNNLGVVLAQQGIIDDAIELFSKAVRLNPNDTKAYNNLQIALQQKNRVIGK
jgi:Tfp pilus assembly protein PilF